MNHFKFHPYFLNIPEVDQSVRQKLGKGYGVLSMSLILLFTLAPVSSVAQDSGPVLEEVIVTAQKRSENLQDIPLAITSLSSDRLRQQNVSNLKGLTSLVPNLDVAHNNGRMKIFIRGIGKTLDNSGSEGSIAVHQDDVVIAYPTIQGTSYHDVERIEVLRGPQGTLFGRNATGGAVNIITRGPSEEFRMDARVSIGNYNSREIEIGIGGPIVEDKLLGRLAVYNIDQSGFGINSFNGADIDDRNEIALRGRLKWLITDKLTAELNVDYWDADDASGIVHTFGSAFGILRGVAEGGSAAPNFRGVASETVEAREFTTKGYILNVRYEINDQWALTSISGYRDMDGVQRSQYDGTDAPGWPSTNYEIGSHFSQEFQLNWDTDRMNAVFGLYYFEDDVFSTNTVPFEFAVNLPGDIFNEMGDAETKSYAAFGSVTWAATDKINITGGLRYNDEKRHTISSFQIRIIPFGVDLFIPMDQERTWNAWTPRLSVDYSMSDDAMVYFTVAKGFKSGQILPGNTSGPIEPEFIWNYEVGLKSVLLDGRLKANLSAFYYDYTDLQVSQLAGFVFRITNAASADALGFEAEITYLLGQNTLIELVYGYLDAEFTEFFTEDPIFPELGTQNLAGNPLPNGPRHMGKVSLRQGFPTSVGEFSFNVDWRYRAKTYFDPYKRESASQDAYSIVGARATFQPSEQVWSVSLWVSNLFDKDAITHNYVSLASGGFPRNGAINNPRTYGLEFNYHTQ